MVGTKVHLIVTKILPFGCILGDEGILLPRKYMPDGVKLGDLLEVFVYTDSEDRIIATTLEPYGVLGEIVCLEVVGASSFGVFLDLGIAKDILMPCKDAKKYKKGERVAVQIGLDQQGRLLASLNLKFKKYTGKPFNRFMAVVYRKTPLGVECIVERKYQGMLFANEIFESLELGQACEVRVKKSRPDGKMDLKLITQDAKERLLELLKKNGGRINVSKESDPCEIVQKCQMSKKAFKGALNALTQKVGQDEKGIYLFGWVEGL